MLTIRAIGMASSLGGHAQAGAGCRAGIARVAPAPDAQVMNPGDEAPQPVPVHALRSTTLGFSGTGRLVALLAEAVEDLGSNGKLLARAQDLGLFLALPDPAERGFPLAAEPDDDEPEDPESRLLALGRRLTLLVGAATGLELSSLPLETVGSGHAACAAALARAHAAIESRQMGSALVCAADSLVTTEALELFLEAGRVKTDENPVGFVPGEAAVAILLETTRRERGPGAGIHLTAIASATEPQPYGSDRPPDGRALAECVRGVLRADAPPPLLVSDHDGEPFRAAELGYMRMRLQRTHPELAGAATWFPAVSFGNTGVASGAVGIASVVRALERRVVAARSAIVLSSAESGQRAAVHVAVAQPSASAVRPEAAA